MQQCEAKCSRRRPGRGPARLVPGLGRRAARVDKGGAGAGRRRSDAAGAAGGVGGAAGAHGVSNGFSRSHLTLQLFMH